jgi:FAD:protein FMN transferase
MLIKNLMKCLISSLKISIILPPIAFLCSCLETETSQTPIQLNGQTMGTSYNITIIDNPQDLSASRLERLVENELSVINNQMSNWNSNSEISRINKNSSNKAIPISQQLLAVLTAANEIHYKSDGAFDITSAPIINLWGFGPNLANKTIPNQKQIDAALKLVGQADLIKITTNPSALLKQKKGVLINLSAIAKGHGIDRIASLLEMHGIKRFLVEIGGDLIASGTNRHGKPWSIGIELPNYELRTVQSIVKINNQAMATSGNYKNFFKKDGIQYSHIIDPKMGSPIQHNTLSVTVLAKSAMFADGWATAMLAMGIENGMRIANNHGIAVFFITNDDKTFITNASDAFKAFSQGKY